MRPAIMWMSFAIQFSFDTREFYTDVEWFHQFRPCNLSRNQQNCVLNNIICLYLYLNRKFNCMKFNKILLFSFKTFKIYSLNNIIQN